MNEFIVWDIDEKMFFKPTLICQDKSQGIRAYRQTSQASESGYWLDNDECTLHQDIGKTDIEGNKIYADSSVLECTYYDKKIKGFFSYDNNTAAYRFKTIYAGENTTVAVNDFLTINKIIGTIQEDKHLLGEK